MIKKILKQLSALYYAFYVVAVVFAIAGYQIFKAGFNIDEKSQAGIAITSVLIIFIIGSVPVALALFNRNVKKWALLEDVKQKLELYKKASVIRLLVIGTGFILGVIFFFILNSQSMIFSAGIAAIGLFFCKPAEVKIISELQIEDPDQY